MFSGEVRTAVPTATVKISALGAAFDVVAQAAMIRALVPTPMIKVAALVTKVLESVIPSRHWLSPAGGMTVSSYEVRSFAGRKAM